MGSYGTIKYYAVDGTCIANHMTKSAPDSLIWSAICLGMATDGLCAPLRAEGVSVFYGYSQSVTFDYDYSTMTTSGKRSSLTVCARATPSHRPLRR